MADNELPKTIGVLIVDDHERYRTLAAEVVQASVGFAVVACAFDRVSTIDWLRTRGDEIDLVLMDVHLGDEDGVLLTRELVQHHAPLDVVLVTSLHVDDLPSDARTCGARGCVPKAELSPSALRGLCRGVYDWQRGNLTGGAGR